MLDSSREADEFCTVFAGLEFFLFPVALQCSLAAKNEYVVDFEDPTHSGRSASPFPSKLGCHSPGRISKEDQNHSQDILKADWLFYQDHQLRHGPYPRKGLPFGTPWVVCKLRGHYCRIAGCFCFKAAGR